MRFLHTWRIWLLFAIVAAFAFALALHEPIPQDANYHAFADHRTFLGIPNFWNVVSNLPFLLVGIVGLQALRKGDLPGALPLLYPAYATFFVGAILVFFGSSYYHLDPDNTTLVWDRLPMSFAFMAFVAIVVGEHFGAQLGRRCLPYLVLLGVSAVFYWWFTEDLRPYVLVQFLPMAMIPLILLLFPSALSKTHFIWGIVTAYAAAKILELFDKGVYAAGGIVSGHTLKHLVAAAAMYFMVLALRQRQPVGL